MKKLITHIVFSLMVFATTYATTTHPFIENKGQWGSNIHHMVNLPAGKLYLENNAFTYQFFNESDLFRLDALHHQEIEVKKKEDLLLNVHAFRINFVNGSASFITHEGPSKDYINYYLGNDPNKWVSGVKKYQTTTYHQLYKGINLIFKTDEKGTLKYDFVVEAKANPQLISIKIDSAEYFIKNGKLHILTSVNELIEDEPYAYQIINGIKKEVKCQYVVNGNTLGFKIGNYDKNFPLIIDPTLIFASYSGANIDNWGYTSTFDNNGDLYGAGVSFGVGYPTTLGAYQVSFNGGNGNYLSGTDITISKFNATGTNLIYSTYLGGSANESPHSLIVNSNDELLVLGTTSSADYPTTPGAYNTTYNGGVNYVGTIPNYVSGSDIVVTKFNAAGTALQASTFVGGSANDGLNTALGLDYNYADEFRGEIIVDANDNCYVASSTESNDFPVTPGAFQAFNNGGQDGIVFKMDPNLSSLLFSTYIGGTGQDAVYSIQLDNNNNPHITGGTNSLDFPVTAAGYITSNNSSSIDGFVSKLNPTATSLLASTYLGTSAYDQCYFVQLDNNQNVYVIGQTEGAYPVFPATVYNNPNSGQFIQKLDPTLSTSLMSTVFGTGSGAVDIALSAFLVNECNYIMISGWGGVVNWSNGGPNQSTTNGLPITSNAIQTTTDGSDYYLMLLSEDADSLLFATYFGGNASNDHVDGGTSRFDKRGIVYQAVCASCGVANNDFPVTPGAWATVQNGNNCNLGVFKIDLSRLTADADVYGQPRACIGDTVYFQNLSTGGVNFYWDFGDGDTSTLFEPYHIYTNAGNYNVMLSIFDSVSCQIVDTDYVAIDIFGPPTANIQANLPLCKGDSVQLNASGGSQYIWTPSSFITNDTIANPYVFPNNSTTYYVTVIDSCGWDSTSVTVVVIDKNITVNTDTTICRGQSVSLNASGGSSYLWSPNSSLNNDTIASPVATPYNTTIYNVSITDSYGCVWDTVTTVFVDTLLPIPQSSPDTTICLGDTIKIYSTDGWTYNWSPANWMDNPTNDTIRIWPPQSMPFIVEVTNGCGLTIDTVLVAVIDFPISVSNDTAVCVGKTAHLKAEGGISYSWSPPNFLSAPNSASTNATVYYPTNYVVQISDPNGCKKYDTVFVDTLHTPFVALGFDLLTDWGNPIALTPYSDGTIYQWTPSDGLSCDTCKNTLATPYETTTYILMVSNQYGCINYDTITIFVNSSLYVPNTFTPNTDKTNNIFYAYGVDIASFNMLIFDRWGELIFESDDIKKGWDGTVNGTPAQVGTYVWKIHYTDTQGNAFDKIGHVNLIR